MAIVKGIKDWVAYTEKTEKKAAKSKKKKK